MSYLPSRKFLKTVAFFLSAGAFFFMLWGFFGSHNSVFIRTDIPGGAIALQNKAVSSFKDSDGDGLYDWEELLLKTDPLIADSSGSGVSDGVAYKTKKLYPEIETPPDLLQEFLNFKGRVSSTGGGEQMNMTKALSEEASLRYGLLGKGEALDENTSNQLVNALATDFSQLSPKDTYTVSRIKKISQNETPQINEYIASVVALFEKESLVHEENPLTLLKTLSSGENTEAGEALEKLHASYKTITESLANLPVPSALAETHLVLLNTTDHIAQALKDMSTAENDPIRGLLGGAAYVHHSQKKQSAIVELVSYFKAHNS